MNTLMGRQIVNKRLGVVLCPACCSEHQKERCGATLHFASNVFHNCYCFDELKCFLDGSVTHALDAQTLAFFVCLAPCHIVAFNDRLLLPAAA